MRRTEVWVRLPSGEDIAAADLAFDDVVTPRKGGGSFPSTTNRRCPPRRVTIDP